MGGKLELICIRLATRIMKHDVCTNMMGAKIKLPNVWDQVHGRPASLASSNLFHLFKACMANLWYATGGAALDPWQSLSWATGTCVNIKTFEQPQGSSNRVVNITGQHIAAGLHIPPFCANVLAPRQSTLSWPDAYFPQRMYGKQGSLPSSHVLSPGSVANPQQLDHTFSPKHMRKR